MSQIKYLENLAQSGEKILLDTNVLTLKTCMDKSIPEEIYECRESLSFNRENVEKEIEYSSQLVQLFFNYENLFITPEVLSEHSNLLQILNDSTKFHRRRLNGKPENFETENLSLLEDYANTVMRDLKFLKKRQIFCNGNFEQAVKELTLLSWRYCLKKRKRNPNKKAEDSNADEKLVATAFCLSSEEPIHLISLDHDVLSLCDAVEKFQPRAIFRVQKHPVHLHTYEKQGPLELSCIFDYQPQSIEHAVIHSK